MTHKTSAKFQKLFNIICAAAIFYKQMKKKYPESFTKEEEEEYELAEKLKIFLLKTSATTFEIKDAN